MKLIEPEKIDAALKSTKSEVPKQRREQIAEHVRALPADALEDFYRVIPRLDMPKPEEAFARSLFADAPADNIVAMPAAATAPADLPPAA